MDKASKSLSDLYSFQICSVIVALVAFLCFYYTGRYSQDTVAQVETYSKLVEHFDEERGQVQNGFMDVHKPRERISSFSEPKKRKHHFTK